MNSVTFTPETCLRPRCGDLSGLATGIIRVLWPEGCGEVVADGSHFICAAVILLNVDFNIKYKELTT